MLYIDARLRRLMSIVGFLGSCFSVIFCEVAALIFAALFFAVLFLVALLHALAVILPVSYRALAAILPRSYSSGLLLF